MNDRTEGILAIIASLFILLSAMFDPSVSGGLSLVLLLGFAIYELVARRIERGHARRDSTLGASWNGLPS